jgi:hypothetical protein
VADYFEELLKDTPMGRIKLLAAWDSLSTETQIKMLGELSAKGRTKARERPIWLKALSSPNEYVRYVAAKAIRFEQDDEIERKVASDTSPLVRSSREIFMGGRFSGKDFDRFPQERKLAIVSDDDPPKAEKFARWIEHAAETKSIGEDELYDVVIEYLCNPTAIQRFRQSSYDFSGDEGRDAGFKAFWRLLPTVSNSVAHCLVYRLPWTGVYGD